MSSKSLKSRDAALSTVIQEKTTLEKSRLHLLNELRRIDESLERNQAQYAKIFNDHSPILQLPTEVTCMIFDLSVSSDSLEVPKTKEKPLLLEVVIAQVCKHWRDVAINYPRLWTRFSFSIGNVKSMSNALFRFDTYLQRSGSQNLELTLDFWGNLSRPRGQLTEEHHQLLNTALKHVARWKTVTLLIDLGPRAEIPSLITAFAPNLEYFAYSLSFPDTGNYTGSAIIGNLNPTLLRGGTPKLRHLVLDCSTFRIPPMSDITTLRIEAIRTPYSWQAVYSWELFISLLSLSCLADLSISGEFFTPPTGSHVPIIHMNNLKHLRYSQNAYMALLLPFLRAPLLETLFIGKDKGMPAEELGLTPLDFPTEAYSFPSLHSLTLLDYLPWYPDMALRILQLTKNIKSISVFHDCLTDQFFGGQWEHDPLFYESWLKLTCITVNCRWWEEHQFERIHDIVLSRPKDALTLRLIEGLHSCWKDESPDEYQVVQKTCTIEVLDDGKAVKEPSWPPEVSDYVLLDDLSIYIIMD